MNIIGTFYSLRYNTMLLIFVCIQLLDLDKAKKFPPVQLEYNWN